MIISSASTSAAGPRRRGDASSASSLHRRPASSLHKPRACLALLATAALVCGTATEVRAQGGQPIPPPQYYAGLPLLYDGDYVAALASFNLMQQQSVKNPLVIKAGGNWIDSICYQAMAGECCYQMGNNTQALVHFTAALTLYASFHDWMTSVQFAPLIRPANPGQVTVCPWYISQRGAIIGEYPQTVPIFQGRINNNQQVFQGGVVQMAMAVTINPHEIVRATCLSLRRWRELLGPTCSRHPLTQTVLNALAQKPAFPNHWSEAYVNVELGLAFAAADKPEQATKALLAGVVAGGTFDHQVTCIALLELGRLALASGNLADAQKYFLESSASACNFADYTTCEDALRAGALTHIMSNGPGVYLPLPFAYNWATAQGLTQLQVSSLVSSAECFCAIEQPVAAAAELAKAVTASARTNIPTSKTGARMSYMTALASYEAGKMAAGDTAFAATMAFQTAGSLWLFHMGLVDTMWQSDQLADRAAMDLFSYVLRDPTPADWATDPMESLSALIVPHPLLFEHWFEVAMMRKEHERALEIADLARRHRFLSTQEFGGRLLNLRWVLEAPAAVLDPAAVQQRVALAGRYVGYVERSHRAKQLQTELRQLPLVTADAAADVAQQQADKLKELAQLSVEQEVILREMALRREPCSLVFPPVRTTKEVQELLPKGHGLLAFFATSRQSWSFLMTKDKYGYWQIKSSPKTFMMRLQSMLQEWGNYEQNKELKVDELVDDRWKGPAKEVLELLLAGSKAELGEGMFEELAIVPDGVLWYLPFEALQIPDGDETTALISKVRIRYAPTVGLAIGDKQRRRRSGNTAVVLGRLFPRDDPEVSQAAFEDLSRVTPGAVAIKGRPPAPASIYSTLFDRLVVLSEITPKDEGPYAWSPAPLDQDKPGGALQNWFALPWGGPDEIVLPGFRTSAERAAKGLSPDRAANELFLSVCGMMSTGARTVLLSRWRTGGQTSYDLVREFVQELPDTTASNAWQRSVELVSRMQVDPGLEPRVKDEAKKAAPLAENPFFWAGYLLVDTGSKPRTSADDDEPEDQGLALQIPPAPGANKPADMKPGDGAKPGDAKGEAKPGDANPAGGNPAAADGNGDGLGLRRQAGRAGRGPANPMPDEAAAEAKEPEPFAGGLGPGPGEQQPPAKGKKSARGKADRKKPASKKKS